MRIALRGVLFVVCLMASGCSRTGHDLGGAKAIVTGADVRIVSASSAHLDANGRIVPTEILCTEPSPDVAKAVTQGFSVGGSLDLHVNGYELPADSAARAAAAATRTRAEAVAQLTQRLATIQLLRDGLHSACEAYGNGAIGPIAYALLLSRYGDTMVTLLGSELAAGNFGQGGASIGGNAGASASGGTVSLVSSDELMKRQDAVIEARRTLTNAKIDEAAAVRAVKIAKSEEKADKAVMLADKRDDRQKAAAALRAKEEELRAAEAAAASATAATRATAIGRLDARVSTDRARIIAAMQREYMEAPSLNAVLVGCVTALDQADRATPLTTICKQQLPTIMAGLSGLVTKAAAASLSGEALIGAIRRDADLLQSVDGEMTSLHEHLVDVAGAAASQRVANQSLSKKEGMNNRGSE